MASVGELHRELLQKVTESDEVGLRGSKVDEGHVSVGVSGNTATIHLNPSDGYWVLLNESSGEELTGRYQLRIDESYWVGQATQRGADPDPHSASQAAEQILSDVMAVLA